MPKKESICSLYVTFCIVYNLILPAGSSWGLGFDKASILGQKESFCSLSELKLCDAAANEKDVWERDEVTNGDHTSYIKLGDAWYLATTACEWWAMLVWQSKMLVSLGTSDTWRNMIVLWCFADCCLLHIDIYQPPAMPASPWPCMSGHYSHQYHISPNTSSTNSTGNYNMSTSRATKARTNNSKSAITSNATSRMTKRVPEAPQKPAAAPA